jgi:hypothetical protein
LCRLTELLRSARGHILLKRPVIGTRSGDVIDELGEGRVGFALLFAKAPKGPRFGAYEPDDHLAVDKYNALICPLEGWSKRTE